MNVEVKSNERLSNDIPPLGSEPAQGLASQPRRKKRLRIALLILATTVALPTLGHAQFLTAFDSIFKSIQSDIGSSLSSVNQIMQQVTKLYQTTIAPLAALNQARGFVANSISSFRNSMNHHSTRHSQVRLRPVRNSLSPSCTVGFPPRFRHFRRASPRTTGRYPRPTPHPRRIA